MGAAALPRCDCQGGTCQCVVIAGAGAGVTGAGTSTNPYIITAGADLPRQIMVADTATVDLHAVGNATVDDPLVISADALVSMNELENVDAPNPAVGDSIVWNGTAWVAQAPAVVPPGAVNVGAGLTGSGSVDNPVRVSAAGVWGTPPLDVHGDDSTVGLAVYVDVNGQLRADPRDTHGPVTWDEITGRPSAFPTTWDTVSGKPTSWGVTGASSGVFTATSGWSLEWQYGHRTGQVTTVNIRVTRTGGTINVPASGNVANTTLGAVTALYRPYMYGPLTTTSTGTTMLGYVTSAGTVYLTSTVPNIDIVRGTSFAIGGTWVSRG